MAAEIFRSRKSLFWFLAAFLDHKYDTHTYIKFLKVSNWFMVVQYQKSTIIPNFGKIQKPGPNTVLCKIHMVLEHKSTSKHEKSSLNPSGQGKTMTLPRTNNGMQLVTLLSFFLKHCSFNIVLMHAKTLMSIFSNWRKLPIPWLRAGYLK